MSFYPRNHSSSDRQAGFSLIEVLIGLVLSGLLMSMVAMVLGQSVTNNEVVRSSAGLSSRLFTLRRILHRDLQNIVPGRMVGAGATGLTFESSHSITIENSGPVVVSWDFSSEMVRRIEKSPDLEFENSQLLMRGLKSWRLEFLDIDKNVWISLSQQRAKGVSDRSTVKAFRLRLNFEDGKEVMLLERIPYAQE
ncbi:prepilin-type N-terminal cleavage/methylation domain-containing protein [Desulfovibrio sp. JC010]|uniref:prepilin-type N-terminal cleavage/methylation domain-containing protein n=1 Tax=Desulfovibrio sp. JC010 TaxID=2593641 RepID=UPI0013D0A485|nr:prepilin-type N-terminal cleavage/methylation domain-containing protein [Desulfovibrio sp. JC010]NDV27136.1 prepilin-type N-terminal cleavage/methylation domain-containing protein [Desulfovibrio sp. JC010]